MLSNISGYNATRNTKLSPKVNGDPRSKMQNPKLKTQNPNPKPKPINPKPISGDKAMLLGMPNFYPIPKLKSKIHTP